MNCALKPANGTWAEGLHRVILKLPDKAKLGDSYNLLNVPEGQSVRLAAEPIYGPGNRLEFIVYIE